MWTILELLFLIGVGAGIYTLYVLISKRRRHSDETAVVSTFKLPPNVSFAVLVLVLAFNLFVYNTHFGIGIGLFITLSSIALYYTFPQEERTPFLRYLLLGITFSSIMIGLRANGYVQGINLTVSAIFLVLLLGLHAARHIRWEGLWLFSLFWKMFSFGVRNIPDLFRNTIRQSTDTGDTTPSTSPIVQAIKVSFLTLGLVLLFAALLSNADPVFANLIGDVLEQALGRIILSVIIASIAIIVLTIEATEYLKEHHPQVRWFNFSEIAIPVSAVALLFGFFLFVQAKYLFGAHVDLASFGLTYSEYVRRGFVELLLTTFIGGLLVYGIYLKQSTTENKNQVLGYKLLSSVIIGQLFLMLLSALKRDLLYVEMFGITRTRIIGGAFILCLAIFFISLLTLILIEKMKERHLYSVTLGIVIFVIVSHNVINVDRIIARAQAPSSTYKDYFYINSLSEDAYDGWKESIPVIADYYENIYLNTMLSKDKIEQFTNYKLAIIALQEKRDTLINKYGPRKLEDDPLGSSYRYSEQFTNRERALGSFNLSEFLAFKKMSEEHKLFFTQVDCLVTQMGRYQRYYRIDTYEYESHRLFEYDYPFVDAKRSYYPDQTLDSDTYGDKRIRPISCIE